MIDKNYNNKFIKQNEKLLNWLRFYKGIDRSELSRKMQLSMPTIYKSIDDLSSAKIVNKKDSSILLNNDYGILVGISIGTSLCKVLLLGFDFSPLDSGDFLYYKEYIYDNIINDLHDDMLLKECIENQERNYIYFRTPKTFSDLKKILNSIFDCIEHWVENHELNVLSIGISCTGIINNKTQTILDAYNLNYLSNRTLESLIFPDKQSFFSNNNIYVSLIQNSNASVIAEKILLNQSSPQYRHKKNILAIYLGVGAGAGLYLDTLYEGTNGHAGEVGHTKAPHCRLPKDIDYYNKLIDKNLLDKCCTCGCTDCYDYKIRTYVFEKNLEQFCDMSAKQIYEHLYSNPDSARLLGEYFGSMINTITSWLDLDLIIFTGKIYKSMGLLLNYIDTVRDQSPLRFNRNDCTILVSNLGSRSPAIGAAIYAYHKKYDLELSWDY